MEFRTHCEVCQTAALSGSQTTRCVFCDLWRPSVVDGYASTQLWLAAARIANYLESRIAGLDTTITETLSQPAPTSARMDSLEGWVRELRARPNPARFAEEQIKLLHERLDDLARRLERVEKGENPPVKTLTGQFEAHCAADSVQLPSPELIEAAQESLSVAESAQDASAWESAREQYKRDKAVRTGVPSYLQPDPIDPPWAGLRASPATRRTDETTEEEAPRGAADTGGPTCDCNHAGCCCC